MYDHALAIILQDFSYCVPFKGNETIDIKTVNEKISSNQYSWIMTFLEMNKI